MMDLSLTSTEKKIAQANMNDAVRPAYRAKAESASDDPDAARL